MFSLNPMKELYESPLPPMALTDYEAFSKFLNQALHCCHETGRDFNVYLDWAIRALASSMAADSAARIFLPKTRTAPFSLDDLIPLSEIPSKGTVRVDLTKSYVVAPIWNNTDLVDAVKAFSDSGFENAQIDQVFGGAYIQELKLAIIDSPSDVDVPYILSQWDRGSIQMNAYPLKDLTKVLSTDGEKWYLQEEDGETEFVPPLKHLVQVIQLRRGMDYGGEGIRYGLLQFTHPFLGYMGGAQDQVKSLAHLDGHLVGKKSRSRCGDGYRSNLRFSRAAFCHNEPHLAPLQLALDGLCHRKLGVVEGNSRRDPQCTG